MNTYLVQNNKDNDNKKKYKLSIPTRERERFISVILCNEQDYSGDTQNITAVNDDACHLIFCQVNLKSTSPFSTNQAKVDDNKKYGAIKSWQINCTVLPTCNQEFWSERCVCAALGRCMQNVVFTIFSSSPWVTFFPEVVVLGV